MRGDPALRDLPSNVVAGIDNDAASVARASDLGALNRLPRTGEPAIMRARLDSALVVLRQRRQSPNFADGLETRESVAGYTGYGDCQPSALPFEATPPRDPGLCRLTESFRQMPHDNNTHRRDGLGHAPSRRGAAPLAAWGGLVPVVAGMWLVEATRADAPFRLRRVSSD